MELRTYKFLTTFFLTISVFEIKRLNTKTYFHDCEMFINNDRISALEHHIKILKEKNN